MQLKQDEILNILLTKPTIKTTVKLNNIKQMLEK